MGDFREAVLVGQPLLQFLDKAFFDLHDPITVRADEMVVMIGGVMAGEFEAGDAVAKIEAFDEAGFNQQLGGPIDGGEITLATGQGRVDLFVGQRMGMFP